MIESAVFFGLGAIGQRHARLLRETYGNGIKLYCVPSSNKSKPIIKFDLSMEEGSSVHDELNILFIEASEVCILRPKIAFICNPTSLHPELIKRLIQDDINIFCEKPLGATPAEYHALVKLLEDRFIFTHIGYNLIFSEAFLAFKELINTEKDSLISIRVVVQDFLPDWHKYEDYSSSYAANSDLGGGVVATQSHELHMLTNIFGKFNVKYANLEKRSRLKIAAEDNAEIILESADWNFIANIHLNYHGQNKVRTISASTFNGYIEFDILSQTINYQLNGDYKVFSYKKDRNDSFIRQIHYLDRAMSQNEESINSIKRLEDLQKLIWDIYEYAAG